MSTNMHNESKKEFQLEGPILFSDAVFAIMRSTKKNHKPLK